MSRKKERQTENIKPTLKKALDEYEVSVMKDSEKGYIVKEAVGSLGEVDRIVLLLYAELQSYTEMSKILGISRSSCFWAIKRIREELRESLSKKL